MINMTQVKIEKESLVELIDFKLNRLRREIERVLNKWNYSSSNKFLEDTRNGTISETEEDAIILTNLKDEIERLEHQKTVWLNQ